MHSTLFSSALSTLLLRVGLRVARPAPGLDDPLASRVGFDFAQHVNPEKNRARAQKRAAGARQYRRDTRKAYALKLA